MRVMTNAPIAKGVNMTIDPVDLLNGYAFLRACEVKGVHPLDELEGSRSRAASSLLRRLGLLDARALIAALTLI
jgi:hypothetical protein